MFQPATFLERATSAPLPIGPHFGTLQPDDPEAGGDPGLLCQLSRRGAEAGAHDIPLPMPFSLFLSRFNQPSERGAEQKPRQPIRRKDLERVAH